MDLILGVYIFQLFLLNLSSRKTQRFVLDLRAELPAIEQNHGRLHSHLPYLDVQSMQL